MTRGPLNESQSCAELLLLALALSENGHTGFREPGTCAPPGVSAGPALCSVARCWRARRGAAAKAGAIAQVVREMDKEELALLVQFVTGTSKVPLEGFKALQARPRPNPHPRSGPHHANTGAHYANLVAQGVGGLSQPC